MSNWTPEPELLIAMPRPVRLARGHLHPAWNSLRCVFPLVFGLTAALVWIGLLSMLLVLATGSWTTGTVTGKAVKTGSKQTTYIVSYSFDTRYQGREEIDFSSYQRWSVGDHFGIKVSRGTLEPGKAPYHLAYLTRFAGVYWPQFDWLGLWVWALIATGICYAGLDGAVLEPRRQKFLVARGLPVEGSITSISTHKNGRRNLNYAWEDAKGEQRRGTMNFDKHLLLPLVGAPVTVLVFPAKSHFHTLYGWCPYEVAPRPA